MVTFVEPPAEPPVHLTDTRALLNGYLDYYRDALLRKLDGLADEQLRTSLLPSGWTPLELLKHLTYVEIRWLQRGFLGDDVPEPFGDRGPGGRPEGAWRVLPDETLDDLRTAFLSTAETSRGIIAAAALDDLQRAHFDHFSDEPPSLAWILFHLLQEYARHVGQLDVVRELADGVIGE
ncbi:DinB superfamily protein [Actinomadura rubteroloni]|uniref:DinB superfamily protein n=1 Tax=Actinomadura rubteroloni TaxID=1926885 RepID=A0A2P4UFH3_9ACTN|nr:DinB family protein [Actinomadura rubteroloni]POM23785.1 DinB superfamily protein [Actinomadura rubteroloni]